MTCYTMSPARLCEAELALLDQAARTSIMRSDHSSDHDDPMTTSGRATTAPGPELPIYDPDFARAVGREGDLDDPELDDDDLDDEDDDDDDDLDDDEEDDDDDELQDELLPGLIEEEPRTVLITGAAATSAASSAWPGPTFTTWS